MKITLITKPEGEGICPDCVMAKESLANSGVEHEVVELPRAARQDLYRGNSFATVPQAYIEGERIGGLKRLLEFLEP